MSAREIKEIKSLGLKKFRDEKGVFTVEGEKMVGEALKSAFKVERVLRKEDIGETAMSRITNLSSPSPAFAIVRQPSDLHEDTEDISGLLKSPGLILALDTIRDPGNMGTIIRIADWFGVKAVLAAPDSVDIFNPKTVQASMGAIFRVRFHYTGLPKSAAAIKSAGGEVYGTFLDGKDIYRQKLETGSGCPVMVITGNESNGISARLAAEVTSRLYIPPYPPDDPGSESLNAAVATAITLSEFRRRL